MRHTLKTSLAMGAIAIGAVAFSANAQSDAAASSPEAAGRLFAVELKTGPSWDHTKAPHEQALFREHSASLKKLRDAGHIIMGARYSQNELRRLQRASENPPDPCAPRKASPAIAQR